MRTDKLGNPIADKQMTVAELIERLKQMPLTAVVYTLYADAELSPVLSVQDYTHRPEAESGVWISDGWIAG